MAQGRGGQVRWLIVVRGVRSGGSLSEDKKGQRSHMVGKNKFPFHEVRNNETNFQRKQRGWGEILDCALLRCSDKFPLTN